MMSRDLKLAPEEQLGYEPGGLGSRSNQERSRSPSQTLDPGEMNPMLGNGFGDDLGDDLSDREGDRAIDLDPSFGRLDDRVLPSPAVQPSSIEPSSIEPASLEGALKQYFGYDSFRPGQREIVAAALAGQDQLVVIPTGGGKSLCFQLPALLRSGVTVVVSPLIALMQDQVTALRDNGIAATFLNSTLRPSPDPASGQ